MTTKPFLPQEDDEVIDQLLDIMEGEHEDAEELARPAQEHMDEARERVTEKHDQETPKAHHRLMSPDPLDQTLGQAPEGHKAPEDRNDVPTDRQLPWCPICGYQSSPTYMLETSPVLLAVFGGAKVVCSVCFGTAMKAAKEAVQELKDEKRYGRQKNLL